MFQSKTLTPAQSACDKGSFACAAATYLLDNLDAWESFAGGEGEPPRLFPGQHPSLLQSRVHAVTCTPIAAPDKVSIRVRGVPCCSPAAAGGGGCAALHAGLCAHLCAAAQPGAPLQEGGGQEHLLAHFYWLGRQEIRWLGTVLWVSILARMLALDTCDRISLRDCYKNLHRCIRLSQYGLASAVTLNAF